MSSDKPTAGDQHWRILGCGHCGHEWGTAKSIEELVCPDCGADFDGVKEP